MAEAQLEKFSASSGISVPLMSVREVEEYQVELANVTVLELVINPSISGGVARASLKNLGLS
jgi:hypothetical protein